MFISIVIDQEKPMKLRCLSIKSTLRSFIGITSATLAGLVHSAGLMTPVGSHQSLELLTHHVDVQIQDGFAITTVEQVFRNPSSQAIDANYRFPIPNQAAVSEFTYWINGQPIHGEVIEKEKARIIVEQEKQAGRKVAVTEQQDFKNFDIQVTHIQPNDDARIKLVYLQTLEMDHGIGRYVYPLEDGGTDEVQSAFWTMKSDIKQDFTFNVNLRSGFSVDAVRLPNHPQAIISQQSAQQWQASIGAKSPITLATNAQEQIQSDSSTQSSEIQSIETYRLDRDIVFYWRLPQGTPGALDVLAYKKDPSSTGTIMLTLTPSDDVQPISQGTDWTLVLDISGSMQGKFNTLIEGIKKGVNKFNSHDRVRIILFNDGATNLTRGFVPATPTNLQSIIAKLESTQPNSGTDLMAGVKMALSDLDADRTSAIWLVTDGVANIGETHQRKFLELLAKKDIRLFTFIMGNGANRPLLKAISNASNGFAINVSNSDDIVGQLEKAASKVTHEALHDIKVKFNGVTVKDIQPKEIASLYRGQQLQIFAHYWKGGEGELVVTAKRSGQKISYSIPITLPEIDNTYPELERLWAFSQITQLLDDQNSFGESNDRKDAITDIAKAYSLVTPHTSMVVLEEKQFEKYGIERNNSQRINTENTAREARINQAIANRNQAQSHTNLSQPRSTLSGNNGGAVDWKWGVVLFLFIYSRRKYGRLMS